MADQTQRLVQAVSAARDNQRNLQVTGSGSKKFLLPPSSAEMLATTEHTGIVDYQPAELVVTVRAGTPLKELRRVLAHERQELASDPPMFAGQGTVGGAFSSGLSGPGRVGAGSLSDAVLGARLLSGRAEVMDFGGQVMKNVAGYDVARLLCGAFGNLGLVLQASLRVHPMPERDVTLVFAYDAQQALEQCRSVARQALPLQGSFWNEDKLYLRLRGASAAVVAARRKLGGETLEDTGLWASIRDHQHGFFRPSNHLGAQLVRVVTPPAAPLNGLAECPSAVEWLGGLRWLWTTDVPALQQYVAQVGGWLWQVGHAYSIDPVQQQLMQQIKQAFDPDEVFVSALSLAPATDSGVTHAH